MKAVILAGGLGTRLRPFTEVIPKPLLPLGEKSILEVQILGLKSFGFEDIYIATNYMSDYIEAYLGDGSKYGVRLHFSKEHVPLGTCGPLTLLKDELNEPFVVMNGDILTRLDVGKFYEYALCEGAGLTVGTKIITTPFRFGNVHVDDQGCIAHVEEKPEFNLEILAGIYCVRPELFEYMPEGEYYGLDSLIKDLLRRREKIARYLIEAYWVDIGQVEDYSKARKEYEEVFLKAS